MSKKPFPFSVCADCCADTKAPYIGENGNWYQYDEEQGKFVDTGTSAQAFGNSALYSNAIKGSASGYMLSLDDISPFEHEICVAVRSKNLLDLTSLIGTTKTANGGTLTVENDCGISGSGTPAGYVNIAYYPSAEIFRNKVLTISKSGVSTNISLEFMLRDENDNNLYIGTITDGVTSRTVDTSEYPAFSKVVASVKRGENDKELSGTAYFQIEEGSAATEYTPYIDVSTLNAIKTGKNMAAFSKSFTTTQFGLTVDYDAETQTFTLNGALDGMVGQCMLGQFFDLLGYSDCDGNKHTLSLIYEGGTISGGAASIWVSYGECFDTMGDMIPGGSISLSEKSASVTYSVPYGGASYFDDFVIMSDAGDDDTIFTDYKFKIQLETGNTATEYEPAQAEKFSLAESTEFTTMSLAPTTNICAEMVWGTYGSTPNVLPIIDCKYNQNINSVIEKLTQAIISLGGMV